MSELLTMRPLNSQVHIKLMQEPEQTEGGIYLPDSMRDNWQSGEVLAVGPGYAIPETDSFSTMWSELGDVLVFPEHALRLIDRVQAVVREEDCIGQSISGHTRLLPLNDWVEIEMIARADTFQGTGIVIPEDRRRRGNLGRIVYWGPGKLRLQGQYYGTRKSVPGILGLDSNQLKGRLVYWSDEAEAIEAGRGFVEHLFVRAGDLLLIREDDDGEKGRQG